SARKSVSWSSTRNLALADFSSWHFQQCCLRNGRTRRSYVVRLSAVRTGLAFGVSSAWTPPSAMARTSASPRILRAFTGLVTSDRMTGPEGSAPCEEVFMRLMPFAGREVGERVEHVL